MRRRDLFRYAAALPFAGAVCGATAIDDVRYIACPNEIQVLQTQAGRQKILQRLAAESPGSLLLSSKRDVLFAVNQVLEYEGRPAGSVESFAIDSSSGELRRIGRRSLSLSSTLPRSCALSPDDRYIVVAAYEGGTYNVLPVYSGGVIGPVCHVRKEIGRGPDPLKQRSAHPHSVAFHPSGDFVIGTDFGSDRVNVFEFLDGRLQPIAQVRATPGSGPGHIEIDPSGDTVVVHHEMSGTVTHYDFDHRSGCMHAFQIRCTPCERPFFA